MRRIFNRPTRNIGRLSWILVLLLGIVAGCSSEDSYECTEPNTEEKALEQLLTRASIETDAFITEWIIPKDSILNLPLDTSKIYNCIIDWGDNSTVSYIFSKADYYKARHIYYQPGVYRVRILGDFPVLNIQENCKVWLSKVIQWGNANFYSLFGTFMDCTNLVSIASGIPDVGSYMSTFRNCTSLQSLPDGLFNRSINTQNFAFTFQGCTNLTTLPVGLFENCTNVTSFIGVFVSCGLVVLPERLFANCTRVVGFTRTFAQCSNLIAIPADLFSSTSEATSFLMVFNGCSKLQSIPPSLFDNCRKVTSFVNTFRGCTSLTGKTPRTEPWELWERAGKSGYPNEIDGTGCFSGCEGLDNFNSINLEWR